MNNNSEKKARKKCHKGREEEKNSNNKNNDNNNAQQHLATRVTQVKRGKRKITESLWASLRPFEKGCSVLFIRCVGIFI